MQVPLNISAPDIALSSRHKREIGRRVQKLEQFYDRITSCRVAVEVPHRSPEGQPRSYAVRIDLTVPQSEIVVDNQEADSISTAIDRAFDVAERRVREFVERRRGR